MYYSLDLSSQVFRCNWLLRFGCIVRALCRIKLLPVTHVLAYTWMEPVYPAKNVLQFTMVNYGKFIVNHSKS